MAVRNTFFILWITLLGAACQKPPEQVRPVRERITESVYASGTVKSKGQYQAFSTVSGTVQRVWVQEGDVVKKGDPLLTIQNETAHLQAENAQIAANYAEWNTNGARLSELRTALGTAWAKMRSDSVLLERQRGLWAQQIGSKLELEQRELAYTNAVAAYQSAQFRLTDAQRQLQFAAAQSQKQVSIAQSAARDFVVRSQMDGRVYSLLKAVGEMVGPQVPLAVIGDARAFYVELQVDEKDIVRLQTGMKVLLSLDSYQGQVFEAQLTKINPLMNERTRTFTAEAQWVQVPPVLYPHLTVEANILVHTKTDALTIPRTYLVQDSLVILANKEKRKVRTGLKDYNKIEILDGITEQETLIAPPK